MSTGHCAVSKRALVSIAEGIGVLNIAGPRESKCRGIYQAVATFLGRALSTI